MENSVVDESSPVPQIQVPDLGPQDVGAPVAPPIKWFFLEHFVYEVDKLASRGIPHDIVTIGSPLELKGITFPVEFREQVAEVLGLQLQGVEEMVTDREGIAMLHLLGGPVIKIDDGIESKDLIGGVLHWFARATERNVWVHSGGGQYREPKRDGYLHVWFCATPDVRGRCDRHDTRELLGVEIYENQAWRTLPQDTGLLLADEHGLVFGQVMEHNIYSLFNLAANRRNAVKLIHRVLQEFVKVLQDPDAIERIKAAQQLKMKQQALVQFVALGNQRVKQKILSSENIITASEREIDNYGHAIMEKVNAVKDMKREVEVLKSAGMNDAMLTREYEAIWGLREVQGVKVEGENILVQLEHLELEHHYRVEKDGYLEGETPENDPRVDGLRMFDIGVLEIRLAVSNGNYTLKTRNLTRVLHGEHHHPHVRNMSVCLGNIQEGIYKLLAEQQLSVVIAMMIQFFHHYNYADKYHPIVNWPSRPKEPCRENENTAVPLPFPQPQPLQEAA